MDFTISMKGWAREHPELLRPIEFTSLGMVVIDDIILPNKTYNGILGGSGTYAILGARLFRPPPSSAAVGWTLRAGNDLPNTHRAMLESWHCVLDFMLEPDQRITRGQLRYSDTHGDKFFQYLTPVLQVQPQHLDPDTTLAARTFHTLASPAELIAQLTSLSKLRSLAKITPVSPTIIWEPRPSSCVPEQREAFLEAACRVDIVSPNHNEFARLFGDETGDTCEEQELDRKVLEDYARTVLEAGVGPEGDGAVLIRAGSHGCLVFSKKSEPKWLPPYYVSGLVSGAEAAEGDSDTYESNQESGDALKGKGVIDPTGAGNAFLGAFAIGLIDSKDLIEAACYGTVAASFALEQTGMPEIKTGKAGEEVWNGIDVRKRLQEYQARLEIGD